MIRCSWCGTPFDPKHPGQRYCKINHQRRANRKRKAQRQEEAQRALLRGDPICPHPTKEQFSSPQQAALLNPWAAAHPDLVLYRCRCGGLHYGHQHGAIRIRSTT